MKKLRGNRTTERGFAMVVGLIIVLVMTAFSAALVFTSAAHHVNAKTATERARALALAEGAVTLLLNDLDKDERAPVKDSTNYTVSGTTLVREYTPFDSGDGTVRVEVTYLAEISGVFTPVAFASRVTPIELYDRVRIAVTGFRPGVERTIDIEMEQQFVLFNGAITSDAIPSDEGDKSDKGTAQDGHITIDPKGRSDGMYINGSLLSNGEVWAEDERVTTENANTLITFGGTVQTDLAGTSDEIPDYTALGSSDQLFDFDRFIAAAREGAGREFTKIDDFVDAMNTLNDLPTPKPMEGIIVLSIDDSDSKIESGDIPDGINIRGTLLFNFDAGTDPMFKVFIKCDCNVNAADLSSVNPADPETYTSGYGDPYDDPDKQPHTADISGSAYNGGKGFKNFTESDDLPAVMFNTGIVDQHGSCNICGLMYGPSFIELENKDGGTQYFNGSILGGAGVFVEGHSDSDAWTVINFDRNTINKLATQNAKGQGLQIIGWRVRG